MSFCVTGNIFFGWQVSTYTNIQNSSVLEPKPAGAWPPLTHIFDFPVRNSETLPPSRMASSVSCFPKPPWLRPGTTALLGWIETPAQYPQDLGLHMCKQNQAILWQIINFKDRFFSFRRIKNCVRRNVCTSHLPHLKVQVDFFNTDTHVNHSTDLISGVLFGDI